MRARIALVAAVLVALPLAAHAKVSWSPKRTVIVGTAGSQDTAQVQLTSSVDLNNAEVAAGEPGRIVVRAFVDRHCDGRLNPLTDTPLAGVPVTLTQADGATETKATAAFGFTVFRSVDHMAVASLVAEPPTVYGGEPVEPCAGSAMAVEVGPGDYGLLHTQYVEFRVGPPHPLVELTTFWGPRAFVQGGPLLTREQTQIDLQSHGAPFALHLRNGAEDGTRRCLGGAVWLNGAPVFGLAHILSGAADLPIPGDLPDPSTLDVRILGKRGCQVRLSAEGVAPAPDVPEPVLAEGQAVTATITSEGGRIAATALDGTELALTIPAGALDEETTITLTPLAAIEKVPGGGEFVFGAHFEPEGLVLALTASLEAQIPPGAIGEALRGFSYRSDGAAYGFTPVTVEGVRARIDIGHFSGAAVFTATPAQCLAPLPTDQDAAYLQTLACLSPFAADGERNCAVAPNVRSLVNEWLATGSGKELADACASSSWTALRSAMSRWGVWNRHAMFWDEFVTECGEAPVDDGQAVLENALTCFDNTLETACQQATSCATARPTLDQLLLIEKSRDVLGLEGVRDFEGLCGGLGALVISPTRSPYKIGDTDLLTATFMNPLESPAQPVTWTSSAPGVATVTGGLLEARQPGNTVLGASSTNCGVFAEAPPVNVAVSAVARISFVPPSLEMEPIDQARVTVVLHDSEGAEVPAGVYPLVWSTDPAWLVGLSPSIDVVTNRWVLDVSPLSLGQGTVTANEGYSGVSAALPVRVGGPIQITPPEATVMVYDRRAISFGVTRVDGGSVPWYAVVWTIPEEIPADVVMGGARVLPELTTPGTYELRARVGGYRATATLTVLPKAFYMGEVTDSRREEYVYQESFQEDATCAYGKTERGTGWMMLDPLPTYDSAIDWYWVFWVAGPEFQSTFLSGPMSRCPSTPGGAYWYVRRAPRLWLLDPDSWSFPVSQFAEVTSTGATAHQWYQRTDDQGRLFSSDCLLTSSRQPDGPAAGKYLCNYEHEGASNHQWPAVPQRATESLSFAMYPVTAQEFCQTVPLPVSGCSSSTYTAFSGSADLQVGGSLEPYVLRVHGAIDDGDGPGGSGTFSGYGFFGCHDSSGAGFCDRCDPFGALPNAPFCRYSHLTNVTIPLVRQGNVVSGSGGDEPNISFNGTLENDRLNGTVVWSMSSASWTASVSWSTTRNGTR